jgi:hypothetical protein
MASLEERKAAIEARHTEQLKKIAAEEERLAALLAVEGKIKGLQAQRAALLEQIKPLIAQKDKLVRHRDRKEAAE